jgi:hypothetical protein
MTSEGMVNLLSASLDKKLSTELVNYFLDIKQEYKTKQLGKNSVGKFVETVVQVLQYLDTGKYEKKPDVDGYLKNLESRKTSLDDSLKLCCARVARAAYTMRNKRNIAHKADVKTNLNDLKFLFSTAQWMLTEIISQVIITDINSAAEMIDYIQMPVLPIVEDFGDKKTVYGNLNVSEETMVLLHSCYPEFINLDFILKSLERRSKSAAYKSLSRLWKNKLISKEGSSYKLTQHGYIESEKILEAWAKKG